ncbi:DEAD/DEAH box helicase family protein [Simplicispira psychrophila]|uniref:restriction endonuclease n=1 Tax=Simplicispira psychrophila TaxID=80882 RepID=UPI000566617F|nr:DEAD/DEAH box helicase family protein [Simplicispira psychrophila]
MRTTPTPAPAQFRYSTLAHQTQAVQSLADVFADVRFVAPHNLHANPVMVPGEAEKTLRANITAIRERNHVQAGDVLVPVTNTPALALDVLMETGTGKTFTFIETMHRLHRDKKLSKFIVLVPSNAIRQGTLKSLQTTAEFFGKQYDQKISVYNYSAKTVQGFIHAANAGISVLVATYQSFAGDSKVINKRGVEANLFGHAKSFMEALADIRPVLLIDEPHRFEGKQTQEYLAKFKPVLTIRFGATFKKDEYKNLVYTLDSLEAFRQRLVKGITVDTVGAGADSAQVLCFTSTSGTAKERSAQVSYQTPSGKNASVQLQAKDNVGDKTGVAFLDGHVVEAVTAKEVRFTNDFALALGEPAQCGMLAEQTQSLIIARSIANHFEREEALFKRGIKALSLFFIDAVAKYLPQGTQPAVIRQSFEQHYRAQLAQILQKSDLHPGYRAYLERSAADIGQVHKGYFARSHSEKGEEEAIKLILQEKEKLLSFDTDLRFIFSMWALQEGWDNPNIFTLCKLAPSNSKITKLQQIGRGLRLAVNQQLERVQSDDAAFDEVNELVVVVPASEGDFVAAIQSEIAAHSVQRVARVFDDAVLAEFGVAPSTRVANRVLDALAALGVVALDDVSGQATLLLERPEYLAKRDAILASLKGINGIAAENAEKMQEYLDRYYEGYGQVKRKEDKVATQLRINPANFQKFRALWDNLNRDAVLRYEIDTPALIDNAVARIATDFEVRPLTLNVTRTEGVQQQHQARSTQASYDVLPQSLYTLPAFVRELANLTRLSYHTVGAVLARMPTDKFAQIRHNESRALTTMRDLLLGCVYELLVNKVSYELREVRVKTALTDKNGQLHDHIATSLCGVEMHAIDNPKVLERSLYAEALMPVDSQIERSTVDESHHANITVFAKLPKINIPTPAGHYNPDFGYVIAQGDQAQALYLVVETKGYDSRRDIPAREQWKIASARQFFQALQALPELQAQGVRIRYETKINHESLAQLILSIK